MTMSIETEKLFGMVSQIMDLAEKQAFALLLKQGQQLGFDQLAHAGLTQAIGLRFRQGAVHQFLHEQPLHLTAAQEALHRVDRPVHQGALGFGRIALQLELPVEVAALPAVLMQVGHHGLAEAVDRDLVHPLRQPLAPVRPVGGQVVAQLLALHGMAAVMAVADATGTLHRCQGHGWRRRNTEPLR